MNQFVAELSFSIFRQHLGASKRSCPAGDGLLTRLHCFIATTWLDSNTTPCLLSKFPYLIHRMESFVPKNKVCLCRGAITSCAICDSSSPTSGYRDAIQIISSVGQSLHHSRHSRLQWRTAFCLLLIVSNNCTKWFTNDILLRNKYYARTPLLCPNIFLPIYEIILSLAGLSGLARDSCRKIISVSAFIFRKFILICFL